MAHLVAQQGQLSAEQPPLHDEAPLYCNLLRNLQLKKIAFAAIKRHWEVKRNWLLFQYDPCVPDAFEDDDATSDTPTGN